MFNRFYKISLMALIAFMLNGCQTAPISDLTADDGINRIQKNYEAKEWLKVASEVDEYKIRYPYSPFIQRAEIMQADAYFQSKHYTEAELAYEDFVKKYPSHSLIPLAYYRMGKSFDVQAPEEYDREQDDSLKAIEKYKILLEKYPNTEFTKDSMERLQILKKRIAQQELFVAEFYWNQKKYASALTRYLRLIDNYPDENELLKIAKNKASQCYLKLAIILEKEVSSDKNIYFKNNSVDELRKKAKEILTSSSN